MEALERLVGRARRRLFVESLARKLAWCWFVALLAATLAIGVGKLWPAAALKTWAPGWLAAALIAGLAAALSWAWARRRSPLEAAVEIDRRYGLKERVSSTLSLDASGRETAAGRALVRDAEQRIRHVDLAEQFRLRIDRRTLLPLAPAALAFALAVLVPVRAPEAPAQSKAGESAQARQSTGDLAKKLAVRRKEAAEKGLPEIDPLLARLEQGAQKLSKTSQTDRQKTLVELNDLVQDVEKRRQVLAQAADLKKQLSHLRDLKQGPADKLGQALEHGHFDQAIEQLDKLARELAGGQLDAQAQKALAGQLNQLQEALGQKIEAHAQMMRELQERVEAQRRAGNVAQADQLQRQLDKLAAQQPQMEQLAQLQRDLERAARCAGQGECDRAAEALAGLGQQLAGMQQDMQEMEMLDDALEQVAGCKKAMACKQCNGQGCDACQGGNWTERDGQLDDRFAHRGGGQGIGVGLGPGQGPETNPDGNFYDSTVKQQPGPGAAKVVGEADGPNRKGRVREEIQGEFSGVQPDAADALREQRLPRHYRDHAKTYFDALRDGAR